MLLALDFSRYVSAFLTNGIRNGGDCLQVSAGGGMTVKINKGMAAIEGRMFGIFEDQNGASHALTIPTAHNQYPRIDRVVLRMSLDPEINGIIPAVLMGVAAANPVAPALSRASDCYELSLAQVRVNATAVAISSANIADERFNTESCGIMDSAMGLDPSVWQAAFDAFMEACETAFSSNQTTRDTAFNTAQTNRTSAFETAQTARDNAWSTWFSALKLDLERYAAFNFENILALTGVSYKMTTAAGGGIDETIKTTAGGALVAERHTLFNADGSITYSEKLYASGGAVLRSTVYTETFAADGGITGVAT